MVFGAACLLLAGIGTLGVASAHEADTAGLMAGVLMSVFLLPVAAFGLVFLLVGAYRACHSVEVRVDRHGIVTVYRVFGTALRQRALPHDHIASLIVSQPAGQQSLLSTTPRCSLVAVLDDGRRQSLVDGIAGQHAALTFIARMAPLADGAAWTRQPHIESDAASPGQAE